MVWLESPQAALSPFGCMGRWSCCSSKLPWATNLLLNSLVNISQQLTLKGKSHGTSRTLPSYLEKHGSISSC